MLVVQADVDGHLAVLHGQHALAVTGLVGVEHTAVGVEVGGIHAVRQSGLVRLIVAGGIGLLLSAAYQQRRHHHGQHHKKQQSGSFQNFDFRPNSGITRRIFIQKQKSRFCNRLMKLVELSGIEPLTS